MRAEGRPGQKSTSKAPRRQKRRGGLNAPGGCVQWPAARPEEVTEAVKETIAKGAPGGGYILASSNSIHPGVKPENYRAMVEAARRFGRYPLDPQMVAAYRQKDYMARYR